VACPLKEFLFGWGIGLSPPDCASYDQRDYDKDDDKVDIPFEGGYGGRIGS